MRMIFAYLGASLLWIGQMVEPRVKKRTFYQILTGAEFEKRGLKTYSDISVFAGIVFVFIVISTILLTIYN